MPRQALVALDARTGRLLDWRPPPIYIGADPILKPSVKALALAGSRLYVGGLFYSIGGESRSSLAALDADTGALLAWNPSVNVRGIYDVGIILVTHGQVIAVGDRSTLNSFSVRTARPFAWPRRKNMAGALAVDGPLVYLGGDIQRPVSALSNNMVRFNIKTILKSNFENFAESLANYVNVDLIVPSGGQVLVSGSFTDSIG